MWDAIAYNLLVDRLTKRHKSGILAYIARLFNFSWGWEEAGLTQGEFDFLLKLKNEIGIG